MDICCNSSLINYIYMFRHLNYNKILFIFVIEGKRILGNFPLQMLGYAFSCDIIFYEKPIC